MSMQEEDSFDSSSLKAFQNKSQVGCFFMAGLFRALDCSYKNGIENKFSVMNLLDCCLWFNGIP